MSNDDGIFGIRAIAFSQVLNGVEPTYEKQKPYIAEVIQILTDGNQPRLVNVNLPNEPVGLRWAHQSIRQYNGKVVKGEDPNGRQHCWFSATPLTTPDEGSDRWAIDRGLVSLTPLRLGLTDESWLEKLSGVQAGIT